MVPTMVPNSCFLPLDYPVWNSIRRRESGKTFRIGAAGGTRTRTAFRPGDFKSPVSAISPPRHCVFAGVLRVTPRLRGAWIHFWQHLLLRETLRTETNETWTIHERLGASQQADWLFVWAEDFQCQVKIACTTCPWTSVSRKSRPPKR